MKAVTGNRTIVRAAVTFEHEKEGGGSRGENEALKLEVLVLFVPALAG
jgi:hypothetical protein